jgi:hypothetical protein
MALDLLVTIFGSLGVVLGVAALGLAIFVLCFLGWI